jgi:hypothetical protein
MIGVAGEHYVVSSTDRRHHAPAVELLRVPRRPAELKRS